MASHEYQIPRSYLGRADHGRRDTPPATPAKEARKAAKEADRAEAHAHGHFGWKAMAALRNPHQQSRSALMVDFSGSKLNETAARRSASLPLDAIRHPRDTPIWKLEAALKCRSCRKRYGMRHQFI